MVLGLVWSGVIRSGLMWSRLIWGDRTQTRLRWTRPDQSRIRAESEYKQSSTSQTRLRQKSADRTGTRNRPNHIKPQQTTSHHPENTSSDQARSDPNHVGVPWDTWGSSLGDAWTLRSRHRTAAVSVSTRCCDRWPLTIILIQYVPLFRS